MSAPVIVIGAGGHAKVIVEALRQSGNEILGLLDSNPEKTGENVLDVPVIGGDEAVANYLPEEVGLVIGLGSMNRRQSLFIAFKDRAYGFTSVVHPAAVVAASARLGEGVQIMAGAVVQPDASLGDNVIVNTGASVDHDCVVGDHVHIGPGVTLAGGVQVGEQTTIGVGATVLENVRIGERCTIAAGATVISDVAADETVAGVPARPKSSKGRDA